MNYITSTVKSAALACILGLGFAPAALAVPASETVVAQAEEDIVGVASSVDDFSTLVAAVEAAGLVDELQGEGPFTVFAPTNEAFEELDATLNSAYGIGVSDLLEPENRDLLQTVLAYHVVNGAAIESGDIPEGTTPVEVWSGNELDVVRSGDDVSVEGVDVTGFDVPASNGVIHVIDEVLVPPQVVSALESTQMEEAQMEETQVEEATTQTAPEPVQGLW
jgi:uncharacterized surface protein with fasciclin (FAS1) repeats